MESMALWKAVSAEMEDATAAARAVPPFFSTEHKLLAQTAPRLHETETYGNMFFTQRNKPSRGHGAHEKHKSMRLENKSLAIRASLQIGNTTPLKNLVKRHHTSDVSDPH